MTTTEESIREFVASNPLPENLRFDGVILGKMAQFTETDDKCDAYGASWYLTFQELTLERINEKREAKRKEFKRK